MAINANPVSSLLDSLPAVFQEDRGAGEPNFLGRFLLGFEHILLGPGDADEPGLEETIARVSRYFEPDATRAGGGPELPEEQRAPAGDFLRWLAGWVALTLRDDWDERRQRDLIGQAVPLYRLRGTKRGVEEILRIYTRLGTSVEELSTAFQIRVHSRVGVDTLLDGGAPFFFRVRVFLPQVDPGQMKRQEAIARAIVDLQKPAHTDYTLTLETPTFRIGVHSQVGVDTLVAVAPRITE